MFSIWLALIITALLAGLQLRWRHKNRRLLEVSDQIPGPATIPVLGNALLFMCKPEEMAIVLKDLLNEYGTWFRFWLGLDLNVVVNDPDDIKTLLSSPKLNVKGPQYKYMADILGDGILSGSGPTWRRHRKIAIPNFGRRAIEGYEEVFNKEVDEFLEKCRQIPRGLELDVYHPVVQATSYVVCQTLMGLTKHETMTLPQLQKVIDDSPRLYDVVFERMTRWWYQIDPIFWMSKAGKDQRDFKKIMIPLCEAIINYRTDKLDTLEKHSKESLMMSDEDATHNIELTVVDRLILSNELNRDELSKETFTIFTSSQEATAKIASVFILMMALHPLCQDKLYEEIITVLGDKDRHITDEDLKHMPYLEMAFKEVIRLFPIGALLQRTVSEDITISQTTLAAGCSLIVPIYHLHRDPRFWDRPNSFDPDRFQPENMKKRPANCYIPFSMGPMDCLGRYFGTKLVKTLCSRFLREFQVTSSSRYEDLKINIAISASPLDGYNVIISPRTKTIMK